MTDLPPELRQLMEHEPPVPEARHKTPDELLIEEVAQLLYPRTPNETPTETEQRITFVTRYRRRLSRGALAAGDDAVLDQLRALRQQEDEIRRRTNVLLAYARTTPPADRTYRLRDLSDASGLPISSIRDRITDTELTALTKLDLDSERADALAEHFSGYSRADSSNDEPHPDEH